MTSLVPQDLAADVACWSQLSQWDRAELGRSLRRHGLTYTEIRTMIPVAKSTLSTWCRQVALTPHELAAIKARSVGRAGIPVDTQWRRRLEIEAIRAAARAEVSSLMRDPLWLGGTLLYWAEGAKAKRSLEMVNTDPEILRIFVAWVRRHHAADARFSLMLHLHEGNDESLARAHWARELDLGTANWHKTFIKPDGTGHRKNHLLWGVCRVRMRRSVDAYVRTLAWIDGLRGRLR